MELPGELLDYFGLPYDVRAGDVGITEIDGVPIPPWQLIVPIFAAIPWAGPTLLPSANRSSKASPGWFQASPQKTPSSIAALPRPSTQ